MITVGIRDLKSNLSFYLQHVKNGEKVIITEHNRIIAEIKEPARNDDPTAIEDKLIGLSKQGEIILAKRKKNCVKLPKTKEKLLWEEVYNEIRADRI